jgi:hypothetical protein
VAWTATQTVTALEKLYRGPATVTWETTEGEPER